MEETLAASTEPMDASNTFMTTPYELDDIGIMSGSARTRSRNLSPRISKLRYWSNEAQAGDSSTTG